MQQQKTHNFRFFPLNSRSISPQTQNIEIFCSSLPTQKTRTQPQNIQPGTYWIVNSTLCHHLQLLQYWVKENISTKDNYYIPFYNLQNIGSYAMEINNLDTILPLWKTKSLHILTKHNVFSFSFFSLLYKAFTLISLSMLLIAKPPPHLLHTNLHINLII